MGWPGRQKISRIIATRFEAVPLFKRFVLTHLTTFVHILCKKLIFTPPSF